MRIVILDGKNQVGLINLHPQTSSKRIVLYDQIIEPLHDNWNNAAGEQQGHPGIYLSYI